eukprot:Nk52_evm2s329 gene=Nk52_evmTU2s329
MMRVNILALLTACLLSLVPTNHSHPLSPSSSPFSSSSQATGAGIIGPTERKQLVLRGDATRVAHMKQNYEYLLGFDEVRERDYIVKGDTARLQLTRRMKLSETKDPVMCFHELDIPLSADGHFVFYRMVGQDKKPDSDTSPSPYGATMWLLPPKNHGKRQKLKKGRGMQEKRKQNWIIYTIPISMRRKPDIKGKPAKYDTLCVHFPDIPEKAKLTSGQLGEIVLTEVDDCPLGQYWNGKRCSPCSQGCTACSNKDDCTTCDRMYCLKNNKCYPRLGGHC